ncbi:MAG: hypothetical protein ABIS59_04440 [Candidatus Saccharibacteria bacterium]
MSLERNTFEQVNELTDAERQQALSDRLKQISEEIAARSAATGEFGPQLANVANTCPTDPAELAMCDSCQ